MMIDYRDHIDCDCELCLKSRKIERLQQEVRTLSTYKAIAESYRVLPETVHQGMLELLVKAAFEAAEISHGRAAELLRVSICDIRERGWVQGKKDMEIEQLRSALKVIRTWASCDLDGTVPGALDPAHVTALCDKTLEEMRDA